jgi:phosphotriesterase-related protein
VHGSRLPPSLGDRRDARSFIRAASRPLTRKVIAGVKFRTGVATCNDGLRSTLPVLHARGVLTAMDRREFLTVLTTSALATAAPVRAQAAAPGALRVQTVRGAIPAAQLGRVLPHEHVLVDFIGAETVSPSRYDASQVFKSVLPHLARVRELGVQSLFECTPNYLGRDPRLLARLSEASGLHLITNTGLYGARQNKFIPRFAQSETAHQLAARWIGEVRDGIGDTGIRPGFIKSGIDVEPSLSPVHRLLVAAAALTHANTGLTIAIHTGRGPGLAELDVLRDHRVAPSAFIWVHAQGARDNDLFAAADRGAWLSFDGLNRPTLTRHLHLCRELKKRGHLGRVLLSHDAGWFDPAKPNGGDFRPFDLLFTSFLPLLRENAFSEAEIDQLTITNPAEAFAIRPRPLR